MYVQNWSTLELPEVEYIVARINVEYWWNTMFKHTLTLNLFVTSTAHLATVSLNTTGTYSFILPSHAHTYLLIIACCYNLLATNGLLIVLISWFHLLTAQWHTQFSGPTYCLTAAPSVYRPNCLSVSESLGVWSSHISCCPSSQHLPTLNFFHQEIFSPI